MPSGRYIRTKAVWNKGLKGIYKHSEATKLKLGNILRKAGEKTRFKKGEHKSLKTEFKKGLRPWIAGRKHSLETREEMKLAKLKNPARYWLGKTNPNHKGSKNVNWKGGISSEQDKLRKTSEYREWRRQVFGRDRYTCRVCSSQGYVQANHIYPFRSYPDLRHDINNGITLCVPCHKFIFKREELFIEFFQGILKNGLNSVELSQETIPSQQERLRKALWACVTVSGE